MHRHYWGCLAAAAMIAGAGVAWAQSGPSESARENVRQSRQYEQLLCSNPAFRARRMAQECGPIDDPQLHASCLASFRCGGPEAAPNRRATPPSERTR